MLRSLRDAAELCALGLFVVGLNLGLAAWLR